MSTISLTASMRSNLLSLQNIASQQDIVQNRLATGLKVSSAIDNPSSYYTASSLNNRAADLTALLDAMSQGIQTIKAASEAIDSGTKFLEQAKAVANQALETAIPAKEWFAEQAGENGAVVETAQELLDAVNAGKETIVVYGKIEMTDQTVTLKQGQKLVGIDYYGSFNQGDVKFSGLKFNFEQSRNAITLADNTFVSDLNIELQSTTRGQAVCLIGNKQAEIRNLNISIQTQYATTQLSSSAVYLSNSAHLEVNGNVNIETSGYLSLGFASTFDSSVNLNGNISIRTHDDYAYAIYGNKRSTYNIKGELSIITEGTAGYGIITDAGENLGGNTVHIYETAQLYIQSKSSAFRLGMTNLSLLIEKGASLTLSNTSNGQSYHFTATQNFTEAQCTASNNIVNLNLQSFLAYPDYFISHQSSLRSITTAADLVAAAGQVDVSTGYNLIIEQYNSLMGDATYKGINLLDGHNLKINFNEDRSSKIEVAGVKADSESLGLKTKEWKTAGDIEKSVSELEEAINSLRGFASQFGNYYSIVTTRQDFTENLINVLEEGADKLTLADMNQESANMLALQTSQQLAVNSLSLASQASQAVLRLF